MDSAGGDNTAFIDSITLTAAAPGITSAAASSFTIGSANTFTVTTTGTPTPTLSEAGAFPSGVTFNAATGVLGGTPAAGTGGTYNLSFTASNGVTPNFTQPFTLTVAAFQAPAITSVASTIFASGTAGTFQVTTTGFPTPALTTGTLPTGVTFVDNGNGTATLASLATTPAGTYPLTIYAANGVTPNFTQPFTLTVAALDSIAVTPVNPSISIALGQTQQFIATGTFAGGLTANISNLVNWTSATAGVATISSTGLATPVATGTTIIQAALGGTVTSPNTEILHVTT